MLAEAWGRQLEADPDFRIGVAAFIREYEQRRQLERIADAIAHCEVRE